MYFFCFPEVFLLSERVIGARLILVAPRPVDGEGDLRVFSKTALRLIGSINYGSLINPEPPRPTTPHTARLPIRVTFPHTILLQLNAASSGVVYDISVWTDLTKDEFKALQTSGKVKWFCFHRFLSPP